MNVSSEEAALLLSRWKQNSPLLRIKLISSAGMFNAVGGVMDFSASGLRLSGAVWEFTIPLNDVAFSFSDPREAPAGVRESVRGKYECGLELRLPNTDRFVLMETKDPEEQYEA